LSARTLTPRELRGLTIGLNSHNNSHLLQFLDSVRSFKGFKRLTYFKLPLIP
jgi:hypothetical protein